jgi:hypothetical protein
MMASIKSIEKQKERKKERKIGATKYEPGSKET